MFRKKGFTLLELVIVIIAIGILASIALPNYTRTVEKSRVAEAKQMLGAIRTAQMIYYARHEKYTSWESGLENDLHINSSGKYFDYMAYGYFGILGKATRNDVYAGSYAGYWILIDENGNFTIRSDVEYLL